MRKTIHRRRIRPAYTAAESWVPIDTRILPDIFSFGHVHGISRVFLTIEIVLVTTVLISSLILAFFELFG